MNRARNILFVCTMNKLRSPTADFTLWPPRDFKIFSAGVAKKWCLNRITREMLEWADIVFVMEKSQRNTIRREFKDLYHQTRIICLYIRDQYSYMDPKLINILKTKLSRYLDIEDSLIKEQINRMFI